MVKRTNHEDVFSHISTELIVPHENGDIVSTWFGVFRRANSTWTIALDMPRLSPHILDILLATSQNWSFHQISLHWTSLHLKTLTSYQRLKKNLFWCGGSDKAATTEHTKNPLTRDLLRYDQEIILFWCGSSDKAATTEHTKNSLTETSSNSELWYQLLGNWPQNFPNNPRQWTNIEKNKDKEFTWKLQNRRKTTGLQREKNPLYEKLLQSHSSNLSSLTRKHPHFSHKYLYIYIYIYVHMYVSSTYI